MLLEKERVPAHSIPVPSSRQSLADVPILSYGFRPFFLGGALWGMLAMVLWIGALAGVWPIAPDYGLIPWHVHEFLFGYVGAIAAGFLLTAIPNWTGRLPVRGGPLLALFALWAIGRVALLVSPLIGVLPAIGVESVFLSVFALVVTREVVAGQNWRNLKTAVLVALLALGNIAFHAEVVLRGQADYSLRAGAAVILMLIMLVGGRIVPSFTRNWLARRGVTTLPAPFGPFDIFSMVAAALALVLWIASPDRSPTAVGLFVAGLAQLCRWSRWTGRSTWPEPLVFVLHVAYLFVPLGFFAVAASILWPPALPFSAALHVWTVGAMTLMTLAVMTRASRGHTGQALTAGPATQAIYLAVILAVATRLAAALAPQLTGSLLTISGSLWILAFAGFVVFYGPMLSRNAR